MHAPHQKRPASCRNFRRVRRPFPRQEPAEEPAAAERALLLARRRRRAARPRARVRPVGRCGERGEVEAGRLDLARHDAFFFKRVHAYLPVLEFFTQSAVVKQASHGGEGWCSRPLNTTDFQAKRRGAGRVVVYTSWYRKITALGY